MFNHYCRLIIILLMPTLIWAEAEDDIAILQKKVSLLEHRVSYLAELVDQSNLADMEEKIAQLQASLNKKNTVAQPTPTQQTVNNEEKDYNSIKSLLTKQDAKRAQAAINRFLQQYPKSKYRHQAMFELANLMILQGDLLNAEPLFVQVANDKKNLKAPDALLRLMSIYWQTGRHQEAEKTYESIINGYPRSPVAQLARVQYQQWINIQRN